MKPAFAFSAVATTVPVPSTTSSTTTLQTSLSSSSSETMRTSRGETIPADGTRVRLDISGDSGKVFLVEG